MVGSDVHLNARLASYDVVNGGHWLHRRSSSASSGPEYRLCQGTDRWSWWLFRVRKYAHPLADHGRRPAPPASVSCCGYIGVVKARLSSSFVHTKTSAVRPFVVLRAPHRTTTRSELQRTLRQPARLFDQRSAKETELRTGKTTTSQREVSGRCQFWWQSCPCLVGHRLRVVDLIEASRLRSYGPPDKIYYADVSQCTWVTRLLRGAKGVRFKRATKKRVKLLCRSTGTLHVF